MRNPIKTFKPLKFTITNNTNTHAQRALNFCA